jgi:hypothetical protein
MKKILQASWPVALGGRKYLPFSDDFTRDDGDLANGWEYTAGKWTIATGKAVGTPGLSATNKVTNGTFDADSDWMKGAGWSIGSGVAARDGTAGNSDLTQDFIITNGKWYQMTWDLVSHNSGGGFSAMMGYNSLFKTAPASYVFTTRSAGTYARLRGNAENGTADNIDVREITLADMFATRDLHAADVDIRVAVTCDYETLSGLVIGLDSITAPKYFLLVFVKRDGSANRIFLEECINGVYSATVIVGSLTSPAYGDGRVLRVVKSGTSLDIYYHGSQIGTTKTITANPYTRHGLLSSIGGSNRLDAFFCDHAS